MAEEELRSERGLAEWRRVHATGLGSGSPDCPEDEQLAALALGELEGHERVALADHVVACRRCAEAYRTLRQLDHGGRGAGGGIARRWPWALATAAALLLIAGLTWRDARIGPRATPTGLEATALRTRATTDVVSPAPEAVLSEAPTALAWAERSDATGYHVRLLDAAGELLWEERGVIRARVDLPAPVRARLARGESYLWVVEIERRGSKERLGPFWFRLGAAP